MDEPKLVLRAPDGILKGECSLCPESVFRVQIEPYDQASYDCAYRLHLEYVHNGSMQHPSLSTLDSPPARV
jgi:hypothetical protein